MRAGSPRALSLGEAPRLPARGPSRGAAGAGPAATPTLRTRRPRPPHAERSGRQTSPARGGFLGKVRRPRAPPRAEGEGTDEGARAAPEGVCGRTREGRLQERPGPRLVAPRAQALRAGRGREPGRPAPSSRGGACPLAVGAADAPGGWAGGALMRRQRRAAPGAEEESGRGRGRRRRLRRQESRSRFPSVARRPARHRRPLRTQLLASHVRSRSGFVFSLCSSFFLPDCPRGGDAPLWAERRKLRGAPGWPRGWGVEEFLGGGISGLAPVLTPTLRASGNADLGFLGTSG